MQFPLNGSVKKKKKKKKKICIGGQQVPSHDCPLEMFYLYGESFIRSKFKFKNILKSLEEFTNLDTPLFVAEHSKKQLKQFACKAVIIVIMLCYINNIEVRAKPEMEAKSCFIKNIPVNISYTKFVLFNNESNIIISRYTLESPSSKWYIILDNIVVCIANECTCCDRKNKTKTKS